MKKGLGEDIALKLLGKSDERFHQDSSCYFTTHHGVEPKLRMTVIDHAQVITSEKSFEHTYAGEVRTSVKVYADRTVCELSGVVHIRVRTSYNSHHWSAGLHFDHMRPRRAAGFPRFLVALVCRPDLALFSSTVDSHLAFVKGHVS